MLTLLFVALWVPAAGHCLLENTFDLEVAACGEHSEQPPSDHDCCSNTCNDLETGFVKAANHSSDAEFLADTSIVASPPVQVHSGVTGATVPPDLGSRWHIVHRAALPVRAPTLIS